MKKETSFPLADRLLQGENIRPSKWQIGRSVRIPVRQERTPIPLWPTQGLHRMISQRPVFRRFGMLVTLAMGLGVCSSIHASQSVSLAWNKSADASTGGYLVFAGSTSGNYTSQMDVGTNLTVTVTGLKEGKTNYFAVSAYTISSGNTAKIAGPISGDIPYIAPGLMVMTPKVKVSDPTRLSFPTVPGHYYEVQASADMKSWATLMQTSVATTNAWLGYADTQSKSFPKRFYRLVMH